MVKNISTCDKWKDCYQSYGEEIQKMYPEYEIIVDGGPFRFHDMLYKIDTGKKTLELDFYLPNWISFNECKKWLKRDLKEKYNVIAVK